MQRVTRPSAVAAPPAPPASPGDPGYFTGGNPATGTPATVPGYEWFNAVQEELVALVLRSGLALDPADSAQLRKSLDRLFGGGLRSVSANTTLTADDAGMVLVSAAAGPVTLTLPAAAAAGGRPLRVSVVRTDATANQLTIARAGSDLVEGLATLTVAVGGRVSLVSDGVAAWRLAGGVIPRGMQVFTESGTFTVPSGVHQVRAKVVGGGGGGGGAASDGAAAGGAGGGYAEELVAVTPGQAIIVTIGAGGEGGAAGNNTGGAGGTSSFGSAVSATGGSGGAGAAAGASASASIAGTGTGTLVLGGQQGDAGHRGGTGILKGGHGGSSGGGYGQGGRSGPSVPSGGNGRGGGGGGGANGHAGAPGSAGLVVVEW